AVDRPEGIVDIACPQVSGTLGGFPAASVPEFSGKNFGLVIAYVIPGFVPLWGVSLFSPTVARWFIPTPDIPGGLEVIFCITLASPAAGLVTSAVRWLVVDTLNHWTGLRRPAWDDAVLQTNLEA